MSTSLEKSKEKLADFLSDFAKLQLGYELSSFVPMQLFHSPEMFQVWNHILDDVKSLSPEDALITSLNEDAPEHVSEYNHLQKTDDSFDLETSEHANKIEFEIKYLTNSNDLTKTLECDIKSFAGKLQLVKSYKTSLKKYVNIMKHMQQKLEISTSELPQSFADDSINQNLVNDVQETLAVLHEYYELAAKASDIAEERKKVQYRAKDMGKKYTRRQIVAEIVKQTAFQEKFFLEKSADIVHISDEMEKCFSKLLQGQCNHFFENLDIQNGNRKLLKKRKFLLEELKTQLKTHNNFCDLGRQLDLELGIIHAQTMLVACTELKVPQSLPIACSADLQCVQQKITEKGAQVVTLHKRILNVNNANIADIKTPEFHLETILESSRFKKEGEKRQNEKLAVVDPFQQKLRNVGMLLADVKVGDSDLGDLCVRFDAVMAGSTKKDILSAIDMPLEAAPECIHIYLKDKLEKSCDNKTVLKMHKEILDRLREHKSIRSKEIVEAVIGANKKAKELVPKVVNCAQQLDIETAAMELKNCYDEFWNLPAFDKDIV